MRIASHVTGPSINWVPSYSAWRRASFSDTWRR